MATRKPWPLGGYIRLGKNGRPTYVIDRWIGGVHFHVSTRCHTERAALKQLERFEANPQGYSPLDAGEAPLAITADFLEEYRRFMREKKRNSVDWTRTTIRFLMAWAVDLAGKDLRHLSLARDVEPKLDERKTCRRQRVEALKGFCTWLRAKELLSAADDATIALRVPPAEPAKNKRRRAVGLEAADLVLPHLPPISADVLQLQSGTAWHISEVRRFAATGEIVRPISGVPLAVLVTRHKSGDLTRTPVNDPEHLAAAERLRAAGNIPIRETLVRHMKRACEAVREEQRKAGVPEEKLMPHWRLGVMRHSVLTHAVQQGATIEQAGEFAHHRSKSTTARYYVDLAVPTVTIPVRRLVKNDA